MALRVLFERGEWQCISSWRYGSRAPYLDRDVSDERGRFTCRECGNASFESLGGSKAECDQCQERYVFGWAME